MTLEKQFEKLSEEQGYEGWADDSTVKELRKAYFAGAVDVLDALSEAQAVARGELVRRFINPESPAEEG